VHQHHRAVATDLELPVEVREISGADGREHHAAETSVRLVEAARQGDDPFAVEQAQHRPPEIGFALLRDLMMTEEGVVAQHRAELAGRGQRVAMVVDDGEAVDPLHRCLARLQQGAHLGDRGKAGSVHLQPVDGADDAGIEQIETVLGMLRQGTGDVRHLGLGALEHRIAGGPFTPAADTEDRRTGQHDERRCPQRQAAPSGSL
jgi:hypothetical protein